MDRLRSRKPHALELPVHSSLTVRFKVDDIVQLGDISGAVAASGSDVSCCKGTCLVLLDLRLWWRSLAKHSEMRADLRDISAPPRN